ncbi:MAG: hypothetical protein J6Y94_03335 [Bacteriovoracaceae bacterium]|nr:hypothetical protein [Bacteriovoracaceae bacterium]
MASCASAPSPEQLQAQQEAQAKLTAAKANVKFLKEDPKNCHPKKDYAFCKAQPFDDIFDVLREMAVEGKGDTVVIDFGSFNSLATDGTSNDYAVCVAGRIWACGKSGAAHEEKKAHHPLAKEKEKSGDKALAKTDNTADLISQLSAGQDKASSKEKEKGLAQNAAPVFTSAAASSTGKASGTISAKKE